MHRHTQVYLFTWSVVDLGVRVSDLCIGLIIWCGTYILKMTETIMEKNMADEMESLLNWIAKAPLEKASSQGQTLQKTPHNPYMGWFSLEGLDLRGLL